MSDQYNITPEEQKRPQLIPYWKHPSELKDEPTPSREFLRYLDKWLYANTSAQAHLSFGGLSRIAGFLVAGLIGGEDQQFAEGRILQQFRYQHVSRTAIVTLAIASEINRFFVLGNESAINYLWVMFAEHSAEAKEVLELRYKPTTD